MKVVLMDSDTMQHDERTGKFLPKLAPELREEIQRYYHEQELSARDIGILYGVDQRAITKFMLRHEISRRTKQEAVQLEGSRHKVAAARLNKPPWNKGLDKSDERIQKSAEKLSVAMKGKRHTEEFKAMIRAMNLKRWADPEYKERLIKNILKGLMKRPTSLERRMIQLIKQNQLPFKYVGDGSFLIGYKNPDFIETNGCKLCLEVTHSYFHDTKWAAERVKHFRKYGWHCIIFFDGEVNENYVLERLNSI